MNVAALITWLITALGGFYLLGTWIARGALRPGGYSRLPKAVVFGHFLLAAAGLVVWIVYLVGHQRALAWTAFVLLVPVALLGLAMFARWLPGVRVKELAAAVPGPGAAAGAQAQAAERGFPIPVVLAHGAFAVATVILVLIAAIRARG